MEENLYGRVLVHEIAGINYQPVTLVKKSLHQEGLFTCKWIEPSALLQEVIYEHHFFDKIEIYVLQGCNFIITLVHHRIFSRNKDFRYIIQKEYVVVSSLYSKVSVWTL